MTVLQIRWGRERFTIDFEGRILGNIKLGELRERCRELTGVPLGGITLIYGGATMKDDNAPLSCFGIKPNGKITMMGTKPTKNDMVELTTNGNPEEYALILRIQASLKKAHDLAAEYLPQYEQDAAKYIASNPPPFSMHAMPPMRKKLQDMHTMLSEVLLQQLLGLDGVVLQPDFEVARLKRREAVKETQRLLDVIDAVHARVKECDTRAGRL
ncbi:hypothetical protein DFQ26_002329 [Actinomortierella ambigua]|nr:hypothetical protein DFQ26_002329 [Actinomortierella ambigua]